MGAGGGKYAAAKEKEFVKHREDGIKRREYGIHLDYGVALLSDQEFRLLYVPCNPDVTACLQGWVSDDTQGSLLLGVQSAGIYILPAEEVFHDNTRRSCKDVLNKW